MAFTPRLSTSNPTSMANNPWWYSNGNTYYRNGYGLPNCTCYCYGRAAEIDNGFEGLLPPSQNGGEWYDWVDVNETYAIGQTPALGAIACWYDPNGVYDGHVATVEEIDSTTGTVTFSNSGWQRPIDPSNPFNFWLSYTDSSTDYMEQWAINRGYQLKGFIYAYERPTPPPPPPPTTRRRLPIWMLLKYHF